MRVQWKDLGYSCYRATLHQNLELTASWGKDGYKVAAFGVVLKERFKNLEDAKAKAEQFALHILKGCLVSLGEPVPSQDEAKIVEK